MDKIPIIAVVGPTASGKTNLAVSLAKHFDAEVLSFDSMQIYRGMDIATAKPTTTEMMGIPHHMIGCVDNDDSFSVARYVELATKIVDDIVSRGKLVVMVGGTGLYLDSFINNISFLDDERDEHFEVREKLQEELEEKGPEYMYEKLKGIDPEAANKIHMNNTGRVLRALEVYETTGHTISYQVEHSKDVESRYAPIYLGLTAKDRQYLYDRINKRVDLMLDAGLLEEVKTYSSISKGSTAKQAIGHKELMPYINGEEALDICVERLKQETRRYAKRQLTWFRRNEKINWLYIDELTSDQLVEAAIKIVEEGLK